MTIPEKIRQAEELLSQIKEELIAKVSELPDNPDIRRLNSQCFVIKSSQLTTYHANWSVEYHDFRLQYNWVIEELRKSNRTDLLKHLGDIIAKGQFGRSKQMLYFHPAVKKHLQNVLRSCFPVRLV